MSALVPLSGRLAVENQRAEPPVSQVSHGHEANRVVLSADESGADDRRQHRARRGAPADQTGVRLALALSPPNVEQDEALVQILAAALVADFIAEKQSDGRFPLGARPSTEEGR